MCMVGFTQMIKLLHPMNCSVTGSWCSLGLEPCLRHSARPFQIIPSSIWDVKPDSLGSFLGSATMWAVWSKIHHLPSPGANFLIRTTYNAGSVWHISSEVWSPGLFSLAFALCPSSRSWLCFCISCSCWRMQESSEHNRFWMSWTWKGADRSRLRFLR